MENFVSWAAVGQQTDLEMKRVVHSYYSSLQSLRERLYLGLYEVLPAPCTRVVGRKDPQVRRILDADFFIIVVENERFPQNLPTFRPNSSPNLTQPLRQYKESYPNELPYQQSGQ